VASQLSGTEEGGKNRHMTAYGILLPHALSIFLYPVTVTCLRLKDILHPIYNVLLSYRLDLHHLC
jgi:hypothetical protein